MRFLALCVLALSLAVAPLGATTVEELSFDEVVARSASIVHGKVVRSWAGWDSERASIWTHYEIQVQGALKGGPRTTLTVSEPGGEVDGRHVQVIGAPRYTIGEEVVVFAAATPIGYLRTCGWGQGKFTVRASKTSPSGRAVRAQVAGVASMDSARSSDASQPALALDGTDFDAFLTRIRRTVARQRELQSAR